MKTHTQKSIALRACVGIERQINKLLIMAMVDLRPSDCLVLVTHVQRPILRHTARGRAALEEAVVLSKSGFYLSS